MFESMPQVLDEQEQLVLKMRYGLDESPVMTQEEIGETLGLSRDRVKYLGQRAEIKLRVVAPDEVMPKRPARGKKTVASAATASDKTSGAQG